MKIDVINHAEYVARYAERFPGFVTSLPMNNPDAALAEMERAITALKAVGVQFFTNVNGAPLDLPRFKPLFAQMASWSGPSGCIQRGAPMSRMIVRK